MTHEKTPLLLAVIFVSRHNPTQSRNRDVVREGLAAARSRGRYGGRPRALTEKQERELVALVEASHRTQWGDKRIQSINTRKQVDDWVRALLEGTAKYEFVAGSNRTTRPLSPAYVRHIVGRTFGAVMKYARQEKLIADNPVERVQLPRVQRSTVPDVPQIGHAEINRLAAEAETISGTPDLGVLIYLLTYTGLRVGEALALTVGDLDLPSRTLTVRRTWTTTKTGERTLGAPKQGGARTVPIPDFLNTKLVKLVEGRHHAEYVFQTASGHPINDSNFRNRVWRQAQQAAGFATFIRVHDLRHLAATYAIQAGADVKAVQRMLGHASATITLDT